MTGHVGHFDGNFLTGNFVVGVIFMSAAILEFADEMRTENSTWHQSQFLKFKIQQQLLKHHHCNPMIS